MTHYFIRNKEGATFDRGDNLDSCLPYFDSPDWEVLKVELVPAIDPRAQPTHDEERTAAVKLVEDHPGVEHIWLNAMNCVRPTDQFAADVGREIIAKVMSHQADDVMERRHIVLRINAS